MPLTASCLSAQRLLTVPRNVKASYRGWFKSEKVPRARPAPNPPRAQGTSEVASTEGEPSCSGRLDVSQHDPFIAAALRLQNLVRRVGSGEEEMLDQIVADEAPESKMQTHTFLGGIITAAAVIICTLCNRDPWGGATLSVDSLYMAAVGALAGLPLVALRVWSWSPAAAKSVPALEDMHASQLQLVAPWFMRMSRAHIFVMMALEVLPLTMLLLPAAQGAIEASSQMYTQMLHPMGLDAALSDGGGDSHMLLTRIAGLVVMSGVAAVGRGLELSITEEEYEVVQTAVDNADRYYRVMSMDMRNRGEDAERAALAFKCVSQAYLETRSDASLVAGAISFLDVMYLGALWYLTGDLAAPAVAALAANWVDYHNLHQAVQQKEEKLAGGSGGPGGSSM